MRMLLITDNYTLTGGAEQYFFQLQTLLKNRKDFTVFSLGFGPQVEKTKDYIIFKALKSNVGKLFWQIFFHPFLYRKLRKVIKNFAPDVIHVHNVKQYTPTLLRALKGYKVVQTIHDYGAVCPTAHNIHRDWQICKTGFRFTCFWQHKIKYSWLIYLAQTFVFLKNRRLQQKIIKQFLAPSDVLVRYLKQNNFAVAHVMPPFKLEKINYSFGKMNPTQFLFAGNIGTHKGIYHLLNEFKLALQKNKNLSLSIVGQGKEKNRLCKKIKLLQLENHVQSIGWQKNMTHYYEISAAVIVPSLWMEAFGLVINEAMLHARPVIGSNRGAIPQLITDGQTGFIFDPLKSGDLAKKILLLADNVPLIQQLGTQAFQQMEQYPSNEEIMQKLLMVYEATLHCPVT